MTDFLLQKEKRSSGYKCRRLRDERVGRASVISEHPPAAAYRAPREAIALHLQLQHNKSVRLSEIKLFSFLHAAGGTSNRSRSRSIFVVLPLLLKW